MNKRLILLLLLGAFLGHRGTVALAESLFLDNSDAAYYRELGSGAVVVLMYHGLDAEHNFDPADFEAQMQYLADNNYSTLTLDELQSWITSGQPALPEKPVVLTFDDNYLSIYTVAYPTLQSHGFTGVNFTHTNYVGVVTSFDHADWNEINEMETAGVIFTESHTKSHPNLTALTDPQITEELAGSKAAIEANIPGKTCRHLAYPYGAYDANVISIAEACGYETAMSTISGVNTRSTPLMELRRYGVNPTTPLSTFASIVATASGGGGTEETDWTHSTSEPGYWGSDYQYAPAGSGETYAMWTFTLSTGGEYQVHVWYTQHANRATNAPYTIHHSTGETTVLVDQTTGGSSWVSLGTYSFNSLEEYTVTLSNNADGYVIADGIWLEPLFTGVPGWRLY